MQPPPFPAAIPPMPGVQAPGAAAPVELSRLFTAALFKAGTEGCTCKCSGYLLRIREIMMQSAEDALNVRTGDNPQP